MAWLGEKILDGIATFFFTILLWINAIIYSFISYIYQIFLVLANGGDIIDKTIVNDMVGRIYTILGVIILFLVAYSLLKNMVNPDEALKGKKSPVKIISDVIISIALIALVPTIFQFAFGFQNALLINNTIGKIIAGSTGDSSAISETIRMGGYNMAEGVWKAFFHVEEGRCSTLEEEQNKRTSDGKECTVIYGSDGSTYAEMWENARKNTTFFSMLSLVPLILSDDVTYLFLVDVIAGIFVLFVLLSYCLDMALRLVKLAVYELIAPIPILARIMPNEQGGKIFSNWLKATLSTFAEVFIRIAILYFAVILVTTVASSIDNLFTGGAYGTNSDTLLFVKTIAEALIIVGIVMFIRQAPEIIKEITGLDGGKYNPLKSAKQGLSLIAGGIAGRSILAPFRAWEQAGQAKELLDFSAIGNQYRRRQARLEAEAQGANRRDRWEDALRKRFGFETQLELANRRIDRGLDIEGQTQQVKNDSDDAIYYGYEKDANGDFIMETMTDKNGNIVYEQNEDGSFKLDANGNKIAKKQKKKKVLVAKGKDAEMTDEMINQLQNEKDQLAIYQSEIDEKIRHIKEGQDLDQKYIDLRGKIKKKALEKINEGHNHIEKDLIVNGQNIGRMNYASMLDYQKGRIAAGASQAELQALSSAIKTAEDEMWVEYSNWAVEKDSHGEIATWYKQAMQYHDDVGLYDAKANKIFRYDKADLAQQMDKVSFTLASGEDIKDHMAFFESKDIKFVEKDGVTAYTDSSGKNSGRGLDKLAKGHANEADTRIQGLEISKIEFGDNVKRIDRMQKQMEERKTAFKSSPTYQRYKAADNANKINDSGKK